MYLHCFEFCSLGMHRPVCFAAGVINAKLQLEYEADAVFSVAVVPSNIT